MPSLAPTAQLATSTSISVDVLSVEKGMRRLASGVWRVLWINTTADAQCVTGVMQKLVPAASLAARTMCLISRVAQNASVATPKWASNASHASKQSF
jgi:hypothetical protein